MTVELDPVVVAYETLGIDPKQRAQLAYNVTQKLQLADNQPTPLDCIDVYVLRLAHSAYMAAEQPRQPTLVAALQGGAFYPGAHTFLQRHHQDFFKFLDLRDTRAVADTLMGLKIPEDDKPFLISSLREILCIGEIWRMMPDRGFDPRVRLIGQFVKEGFAATEAENMAILASTNDSAHQAMQQFIRARRIATSTQTATA